MRYAFCLNTNIIYVLARHKPSNRWKNDSLNEGTIRETNREREKKKKKKCDSNANKQTNQIEKRQQNTLNFWQQMKPDREVGRRRAMPKHELKKKNNISSSTVVYLGMNAHGFYAHFFHSFVRWIARTTRQERVHTHTALTDCAASANWLAVYSPRFLAAVDTICCTFEYDLSPHNFVRSHAKWCNIKTRTQLIFQTASTITTNEGDTEAKKYASETYNTFADGCHWPYADTLRGWLMPFDSIIVSKLLIGFAFHDIVRCSFTSQPKSNKWSDGLAPSHIVATATDTDPTEAHNKFIN